MAITGRVQATMGIDVGRTRTSGVLLAADGRELARASAEHPPLLARGAVCEYDPEAPWVAFRRVATRLKALVEVELVGLGLAGEAGGLVFLDRAGLPVRPAVAGADRRAVDEAHELVRRLAEAGVTLPPGRRPGPCLPAAKILWLAANEPETAQRVARVLAPKDEVRRRLTGELATDAAEASATGLLDLAGRRWSAPVLEALGLPADLLPEVFEGADVTGRVSVAGAAETGLPEGLPVVAGGTTLACGALAAGLVADGDALAWLEPGAGFLVRVGRPSEAAEEGVEILCDATGGFHRIVEVPLASSPLAWLAREIVPEWAEAARAAGIEPEDALLGAAAEAEPGASGLLFLPALDAAAGDPAAPGAWLGLRPDQRRAELARSLAEGLAAALAERTAPLRHPRAPREPVRLVGRAAAAPAWRGILAAKLGLALAPLEAGLDAARGAAMLAGIGVGLWSDPVEAVARAAPSSGPVVTVDAQLHAFYRAREPLRARARAFLAALEI